MSTAAIAAIIATVPGVAVQPAVAAEPEGGLSVPSSAWAPPAELNRTPAGGAPPGRPWGGEAGVASVPCDENVATGILRQYPFERFPVSDRSELLVNTHNGNVVITARDLSIRGTGQNLSLSHVYNSKLPGAGAFGTGWSLNTGPDLGLTFDGGDVVLHGESGYCARYSATDGGGYTPAPGVPAELERLDNGNYELTFNDDKDVWMFDAQGWLLSQADRNDNVNTVRYTSAGLLASITDSQGRVTTVAYDDAGRITKLTDPTGTTAGSYRYNQAGQLAEYTDRDGKTTYLQYDAAGNLTLLEDPAHKRTRLLYDGSDRVVEVRIPGRSGTSNTRFD
ncbi:RHS repeat domain-containing protein, partial [Amycolatopsis arida]